MNRTTRGHRSQKLRPRPRFSTVSTVACLLATVAALPSPVSAQNVETDPVQCWWRTSAGAVRTGEPFSAVLTCAVVDTPDVKVVVDESRLEPSVAQFAPFEVLGGSHAADLRSGDRRFFQYEYRMRLIAENMFGKDATLPETKLSYRVQSRVSQKAAMEGRDQTYVLPPLSVRILSLVPADASDIRDASAETFVDLDRRTFRANLLTVIGGVLFALAALVAILTVVRVFLRARKPTAAADRLVGDAAILRGVGRELNAVQRERENSGWTSELASRALAALRIVATYALGRRAARAIAPSPVTSHQSPATVDRPVVGGRLVINVGWPRTRHVAVSGAATPQQLAYAIARSTNGHRPGELESIEEALSRFTVAQYGRPSDSAEPGSFDDGSLDESLRNARQVLRRLKIEQTWIMRRLGRSRKPPAVETRVWSR
jgi:hypothetical protein